MEWVQRLAGVTVLAVSVVAQQPKTVQSPKSDNAQLAQRLTRQLELPERRTEAWRGLQNLGPAAAAPLAAALADPRADVAVRAAWILGLLGPAGEAALPSLRAHRSDKEPTVAHACGWAIARITFRGTLLADYEGHDVVHLDADGKELRKLERLDGPWHAEPLADDHLLVAEYGGGVREFDAQGKEVWKQGDLSNPYYAQRLPGGNTLISDAGNGRVVEYDAAHKVVFEKKGLRRPVHAERLPDGHLIVVEAQGNTVVEFDERGEQVWKVDKLVSPMHAARLPNGNTLIAVHQGGQVIEYDRAGEVVGKPLAVPQAQVALRLANGHTLVAATRRWVEFDEKGEEIWHRDGKYAVGILRQ
jgi:hypothetical protein